MTSDVFARLRERVCANISDERGRYHAANDPNRALVRWHAGRHVAARSARWRLMPVLDAEREAALIGRLVRRFPLATAFLPKPKNIGVCSACEGLGRTKGAKRTADPSSCECGGLGWKPLPSLAPREKTRPPLSESALEMRPEISLRAVRDEVFGPDVVLNISTGDAYLRFKDGHVVGAPPLAPTTIARLVWVRRPILVVCERVIEHGAHGVAEALRQFLAAPTLPIVFVQEVPSIRNSERLKIGCSSDVIDDASPEDLARAAAQMILAQHGEVDQAIDVHLNGDWFSHRVQMYLRDGGPAQRLE